MESALINLFVLGKRFFQGTSFKYFSLLAFSFLLLVFTFPVAAQEIAADDEGEAPPPLKIISKQEKSSLAAAATDVSSRTKLSLELMENRLKQAEDFYTRNLYDDMFVELGGFSALIDDTLDYLHKNDDGRGKILNNFKRLEISLRKFAPRIELIRRELPARYESYVRRLIKNVRDARAKAVEPLFDDTVVPNDKQGNLK